MPRNQATLEHPPGTLRSLRQTNLTHRHLPSSRSVRRQGPERESRHPGGRRFAGDTGHCRRFIDRCLCVSRSASAVHGITNRSARQRTYPIIVVHDDLPIEPATLCSDDRFARQERNRVCALRDTHNATRRDGVIKNLVLDVKRVVSRLQRREKVANDRLPRGQNGAVDRAVLAHVSGLQREGQVHTAPVLTAT